MADVQQTYRFKFEFDRKEVKKQLKEISLDVKEAIAQIGDASDKVVIFKELVSYLSNVDKALESFKNKHKDDFANIFGNPDKAILGALTEIFNVTQQSAQAFVTLRDRISDAESSKASLKTLRGIAEELNALFVAAGRAPTINIDSMFSGKGSKAGGNDFTGRIQILNDALDDLVTTYAAAEDKLKNGFNFGVPKTGGIGENIAADLDKLKKIVKQKVKAIYDELTTGLSVDYDKIDEIQDALKEALGFNDKEFFEVSGILGDLLEGDIEEDDAIASISKIVEAVKSGAREINNAVNDAIDDTVVSKNTNKSIQILKQQLETVREAGQQIGEKEIGFAIDVDGAAYFIESCDNMVKASDEAAVAVRALNENLTIIGHTHPDGGGQFSADDYISTINQRRAGVMSPAMVMGDKYASILNLANATDDILIQIENVLIRHGKKGSDSVGQNIIREMQEIFSANGMPDALQVIRIAEGMDELAESLYKIGTSATSSKTPLQQLQALINYYSGNRLSDAGLSAFENYWNEFESGAKNASIVFDEVMEKLGTSYNTSSQQYQALGSALKLINTNAQKAETFMDAMYKHEADDGQLSFFDDVMQGAQRAEDKVEELGDAVEKIYVLDDQMSMFDASNTSESKVSNGVSEEFTRLEALQQKLLEVKAAVDAKTSAFEQEYVTVDAVVDAEIVSLGRLEETLNDIILKVKSVTDSIAQIGQNSVELNVANSEEQLESLLTSTDLLKEIDQLRNLQSVVIDVKDAVIAKTKAFYDEGAVVGQSVGKEIAALTRLSDILDNIIPKINAALIGIANLKQHDANILNDDIDAASKKQRTPDEQFKIDKSNAIKSLDAYRNGLEGVAYVSEDTRQELRELAESLSNVSTPLGLKAVQDDLEKIRKDVELTKKGFIDANIANIASAKQKLTGSFNKLGLDQKQNLGKEYEDAIIELVKLKAAAQDGEKVELDAINNVVSALQKKINAYQQVNKEANKVQQTAQKNAKFGSTQEINATAKLNSLKNRAGSNMFDGSTVVSDHLKELEAAYDRLIDKKNALNSKDAISDADKAEFKQLTKEYNDCASALDKILISSENLMSQTKAPYMLGSDFVDDVDGRRAAFDGFLQSINGLDKATIKFDDNFNKCTYTVKNGDGTITKMSASFTEAKNAIVATAGETKKVTSGFASLFNEFKGKLRSIGTYLMASFSFHEIWSVIRQGVTYVKEIDIALTELRKVTNQTEQEYKQFLNTMSQTAGVVGSTVKDLTSSAADWARLNI